MSDMYAKVRVKGLKFKGEKKRKKKRKHEGDTGSSADPASQLETRHGSFWLVKSLEHLTGNALIETVTGGYLTAVDDGTVTVTLPRPPDTEPENMPDPQDIITIVKVSDTRVAFKTAYGRYISSAAGSGDVEARTEAMGVRELWQPMMKDDGIFQFRCADKTYLSAQIPGQPAHARGDSTASPGTIFRVHSGQSMETAIPKKRGEYDIEGGSLKSMEENFGKKFQSYQSLAFKEGSKIKVSSEDRKRLKTAQKEGNLHVELLDRRSKLKADRYCK